MLDIDAEPKGAGVVDRLLAGAKSVVRVRRTSAPPEDKSAEGIIARMETALRENRVADVLAEAKGLEARVAAPAQDWLKKVEARHAVDGALAAIDNALKAALGAKTAAPAAATPADKGAKQ